MKDGSVQIKITPAGLVLGTLQEQTCFIYSLNFLISLQNNEVTFPDSQIVTKMTSGRKIESFDNIC